MDSLLTILAIIALSAISNWVKRRSGQEADEPDSQPPPPLMPRGSRAPKKGADSIEDWEREVRKIFDIEEPPAANPKPVDSTPPPVVVPTTREGQVILPVPTPKPPRPMPAPQVEVEGVGDSGEGPSRGGLSRGSKQTVMERTSSRFAESVAARMSRVRSPSRKPVASTWGHSKPPTSVALGKSRFAGPNAVREAFVSSLIFGLPKGLDGDRP